MKPSTNDVIDSVIKALELLKKQNDVMEIEFIAPHIEEIGGDAFYNYGVVATSFHITYKGLYQKVNNLMGEWEKIK